MSLLADIFICILCSIVDFVSFAVFRIIAVLSVTTVYVIRILGASILSIFRLCVLEILVIWEYIIGFVSDLLVSFTFAAACSIGNAANALLSSLISMSLDIIGNLYTAFHDFADLMSAFLLNIFKLVWLSMLSIWNNFVDAAVYAINNL